MIDEEEVGLLRELCHRDFKNEGEREWFRLKLWGAIFGTSTGLPWQAAYRD